MLRALLAELPLDEFRVVAILHPNIWYGHGSFQVHQWLSVFLRSGLTVVPPEFGWRAALTAADYVIGDHGSVTAYGAALIVRRSRQFRARHLCAQPVTHRIHEVRDQHTHKLVACSN